MKALNAPSLWHTTPRASRLIFLLAVFFIFAGLGFANDSIDMGRQPPLRFAVAVLLSGLFPVAYAASGVILRGKFWKAFIPLFVVHFLCMALLANWLPDGPQLVQFNAAETSRLNSRLSVEGLAIMVSVTLGYVCFIYTSISEGRRYLRTQTEKVSLESEMAAAHEVQSVMVPEDLPPVFGYELESVYRPAAEVRRRFLPGHSSPKVGVHPRRHR